DRQGAAWHRFLPRARLEHGGRSPHPGEPAMKIVLAGAGAFGVKHLEATKAIGNIEVVSLVGRTLEPTRAVAQKHGVPHATTELAEALSLPGVEAAILATPTQLHASQAIACMEAGTQRQR